MSHVQVWGSDLTRGQARLTAQMTQPFYPKVLFGDEKTDAFSSGKPAYQVVGGSHEEGQQAFPKLMKARRHAQINRNSPLKHPDNKRFYGALLEFDNGQEVVSSNIILLRQRPRCDVDIAISHALNQWLENNRESNRQTPVPKVKALYLANADPKGLAPNPCEACLEWLNTNVVSGDTVVYTWEDKPGNQGIIRKRTVKDMLPLHKENPALLGVAQKALKNLPIELSQRAQNALQEMEHPLTKKQILKLTEEAKAAYRDNERSGLGLTRLNVGSAAIASPFPRLHASGSRFEWARRFVEQADLVAGREVLQKNAEWQLRLGQLLQHRWIPKFLQKKTEKLLTPPSLLAIAYYGNDPNAPQIGSLGRLHRHRGSDDTLVITVEKNAIQVRTMRDYLPETYETPHFNNK